MTIVAHLQGMWYSTGGCDQTEAGRHGPLEWIEMRVGCCRTIADRRPRSARTWLGLLGRSALARLSAFLLLLLLGSCSFPLPQGSPTITPPAPATPLPSASPVPSAGPTALPSPTATTPPTTVPSDLYLAADGIAIYPGPELYSGDVVTFDVRPFQLGDLIPAEIEVRVYRRTADQSEVIAEGNLGYFTFDNIPLARMVWAWDIGGLFGPQELVFWVDPDDQIHAGDEDPNNNAITVTVDVLPPGARSPFESAAAWAEVTTDCCIVHYLTGSSAERDLAGILATAERGVNHAQERLGASLPEPFEVYLINRVIAHGAYARDELVFSYLDRRYTATDLETAFRHEATHVLDGTLIQRDWPPAMLREGLAVWVADGHFKVEAVPPRVAALLQLDMYIPLNILSSDFYPQQHEIGYLEAAAFIAYLVETYGWESFLQFYTTFDAAGETEADRLDAELREHYDLGLAEMEDAFLAWLGQQSPTPEHGRDVKDTIYFFDTVRRYEALYDPQAYFMSGWLPDPAEGESHSIEADFVRHPRSLENIALETMLIAAREEQVIGHFVQAEELLDAINRVLDQGHFADPLAADYLAVVAAAAAAGYEVQRIDLGAGTARVWVIATWPELAEFNLQRGSAGWTLALELD